MSKHRRVIFPPADYWIDPPKEEPVPATRKSTPEENEAALAMLAAVEASYRGDQTAADVVLDQWRDNLAPVLQFGVALLGSLIRQCVDHPDIFIDGMRTDLINAMAGEQ